MDAVNPKYILASLLIQQAPEKALKSFDFSEIKRLRVLMGNPFKDRPDVFKI